LLAQTQKQNRQQNRGVFAHKGAQTSAIIKFLSVLTTHTGATCNQPVEPVKDWRSDCLRERDLLVGEFCGVVGRLHSSQGLTQSNNNAKLNNSAKTYRRSLETKCENNKEQRGKKKTLEKEGSSEAQGQAARSNKQQRSQLLFFLFFLLERKRLELHREARGQGKRPVRRMFSWRVRFGLFFLSFLFWTFLFLTFFSFFWEKSKPKQA
jgi:hypothetical protein